MFFSGTAVEISPIGSIDRMNIGNGGRGPVTHRIQDAFVLSAWFARQAVSAHARGQPELAREARAHKAFFLEASHAHHRAFLAQSPAVAVRRALAAMARTRSAA